MLTLQFSPKSSLIRRFIEPFQLWLEEKLGGPADAMLQLRFEQDLSVSAAAHILPKIKLNQREESWVSAMRGQVLKIEFPPGHTPAISLSMLPDYDRSFASGEKCWVAEWLDCPVAMHLKNMAYPVIVMNVPYVVGTNGDGGWREVVLTRRDSAQNFLNLIQEANTTVRQPSLYIHQSGVRKVRPTRWEDLVLDSSVVRLLQADYQNFFQREAWFRQHRLAFRRGYLLYGPPGNGKTSAVRAMLSHPGVTGHTINLFREHTDDDDLSRLFENAASTAPAVIVLEDIDRYFDQQRASGSEANVSLQHLLNCLDGAATQDGVVVVATANNPQVLDSAILRRPGRFDRVVGFPNPSKDLRTRYLHKLSLDLDTTSAELCAKASDGFSFAQLQEAYIFAGQFAFDEKRSIAKDDILTAIYTLRKSLQCADWKGEAVSGFKVAPDINGALR